MVETSAEYVPTRGEAVWISLHPQAGDEQAGRRPAVVLSPAAYNGRVGLAIFCPITNQRKDYPFEVAIPSGLPVRGGCWPIRSRVWIGVPAKQNLFVRYRRRRLRKCWQSSQRCCQARSNHGMEPTR
jgi:PemK-like, MazF-like toxin of type II toxin-antitoxin system